MSRNHFSVSQSGSVTPKHLTQWSGKRVISDAEALASDIHGLRVSYALTVDFNATNTDTAIGLPLPAGVTGYRVHGIRISGATAAINAATCGVFTEPGGTGIAVVATGTPVTVTQTGPDTNNNMQSLTIVNQDIIAFGDTTLYFRVQTPEGSSAKANVNVVYELLDITSTVSKLAPPPPPFPVFQPVSSAGVFNSSGVLVRTLWAAQTNDPRVTAPAAAWDGLLDDGTVAPTGTYSVQVLTGNTKYTWEGVIGNSGTQPHVPTMNAMNYTGLTAFLYGVNYHTHGFPQTGMCITDAGEIYWATQYDERFHTLSVSTTADPQTNNTIIGNAFRVVWMTAPNQCCTDGTRVYFNWNSAYTSGGGTGTFVWAVDIATKQKSQMTSGTDITTAHGGPNVEGSGDLWGIWDFLDTDNVSSFINDIAVQKAGNIIFATRNVINTILSGNKTTGASLQTFTSFLSPTALATNPATGDLWVSHLVLSTVTTTWDPTTITPFMVLSNGNLTASNTFGGQDQWAFSNGTGTKIYFEEVVNVMVGPAANNGIGIGISDTTTVPQFFVGSTSHGAGYFPDGEFWTNNTNPISLASFGAGDNIGVAVDITNHKIWFRKNGGLWNNDILANQNPATGTGGLSITTVGSPVFAVIDLRTDAGNKATAQFASGSWTYAAPAGFSAIAGQLFTPTVSKMTCDVSGNLTDTGLAISFPSGFPSSLAISPDGSMLLVADSGYASQQVKAFNTSDGSVKTAWGNSGTLGQAGGYASNGPAVTFTKFMFSDPRNGPKPGGADISLCFASDASFWVNDPGNSRTLHFSAGNSPTYIEQVSYLPLDSYATWVCHNDDTRIFGYHFLEYKIDYSKPLDNGTNGSWTLVNNWYAGRPFNSGVQEFNAMTYTGTFSNGRTYAPFFDGVNNVYRFMELTSSGLRDTGVLFNDSLYIDRQFNLWSISQVGPGQQVVYARNSFTGFDGSGNPTFQTDPSGNPVTTVVTSQVLPTNFPHTNNQGVIDSYLVEPLANGVIPVYDIDATNSGFHVGGIDSGTGLVKFMAHPYTSITFGGVNTFLAVTEPPCFMGPGTDVVAFNAGGAIWYKPGAIDFFTGYPGEDWGNNQTNLWSHWHETGLMINRFGVAGPYFGRPLYPNGTTTTAIGPNWYLFPIFPTQVTIAAWINPSILDTTQRPAYCTQSGSGIHASIGVVNSNVYFYYNWPFTGPPNNFIVAGTVATSTWYRVVATVNAGGAALYINGTLVGTGPGTTLPTKPNLAASIGSGVPPVSGPATFFGGAVADLAVWNTALSSSQVTSLQTQRANTIGANANLVGYWPMLGTEIEIDQSGNVNSSFGGIPVVAGPPGFPLFNGVNNARNFNGTSHSMLLARDLRLDPRTPYNELQSSWRGMPGMAGNAKLGGLAFQNGSYFLYHNDEWYHGGKHRWRIDGIGTVTLAPPVTVSWNSASYVPPSNGPPDLLASLPFQQANLPNNSGGWVRNPTSDTTTPVLNVYTNACHGWRFSTRDLVMYGQNTSGSPTTSTLSKSWTRTGSGDWNMDAEVAFVFIGASPTRALYIDILDNNGKKIVRIENSGYPPSGFVGIFLNNGAVAVSPTFDPSSAMWDLYYFAIPRALKVVASVLAGTLQVTYGDYTSVPVGVLDAGADITKPSQFMLTWTAVGADTGLMGLSMTKLVFNI